MRFVFDKLGINNFIRFRGVTDSTNDFGSFSQGSNPCGTAILIFF